MKRRFSKTCFATAVLLLAAGICPAEVGQPVPEGKRQPKERQGGCLQDRRPRRGQGGQFLQLEKEIQLGKQLAADVERNAKIVDDPVIAEYVNRIGQNIVNNSDAKCRSRSR